MTPRQRVLAAMRRTTMPDRCPFEISWGAFTPGLMQVYRGRTGSTLEPCEHFDFDTRSGNLAPSRKQADFRRFYPEPIPDNVAFDEWGVGMVPGPVEHLVEFKYHPLAGCERPEQVLAFDWPDVDADYRFEPLAARVADYQARGYAVTGELYQTIFEMAWLLRGMENLLLDFHTNPAIAHAICEKLTQLRERQAVRYAESGVDILNPVQPECNDLMAIGRQSRTGPQRAARCFVGQLPRLHQLLEVPPGQRLIETTAQSGLPVGASLNCAREWCDARTQVQGANERP